MAAPAYSAFLQWALPRLGRRWAGYRKVRGLPAKRIAHRVRALGLADLDAYRRWLETHPEEWAELDALLGIPISRFYRDRGVFDALGRDVLPALARAASAAGRTAVACWSAGCASGEEPYTLAILWRRRIKPAFPRVALQIVATDSDAELLDRGRAACYEPSSLKELPDDLRTTAFERRDGLWCLRDAFRRVEFLEQDLRARMPDGPFDLVLCRNVVATYYAPQVQRELIERIVARIRAGGALVLGLHEALPEGLDTLFPWAGARAVWRRRAA